MAFVHHDQFVYEVPKTYTSEIWRRYNSGKPPRINVAYNARRDPDTKLWKVEVYYIAATISSHSHITWIPSLYDAIVDAAFDHCTKQSEALATTGNRLKSENQFK